MEKLEIASEMSREYCVQRLVILEWSPRCSSRLFYYFCGHFMFRGTFSRIVSVIVTFCRGAALSISMAIVRLPTINSLWPVDVFVGQGSSEYGNLFGSFMKKSLEKNCSYTKWKWLQIGLYGVLTCWFYVLRLITILLGSYSIVCCLVGHLAFLFGEISR
jgi:hypothetical protein